MVYRAMGVMSGSSLDGIDIVLAELQEASGAWQYSIVASDCFSYPPAWVDTLKNAHRLDAFEYLLLHASYGQYLGKEINRFIAEKHLDYKVQLIASHGHTVFHAPSRRMTAQLGDGAAIAAVTGINVVSDLRAMDIALGGQGAPIVPIGEKLLLGEYDYFLNIGGIANISVNHPDQYLAFDVCPANRVLNMLIQETGLLFDDGGRMASSGSLKPGLLHLLNSLDYYSMPFPKSLSNDFGTEVVYPLVTSSGHSLPDQLRTYVEHIAFQVCDSIRNCRLRPPSARPRMLVTGGGAHHALLVERISALLGELNIETIVPDNQLVDYKEALVMALIGVLRWREEINVLASVTGATRNSIGGAVWIGQEG